MHIRITTGEQLDALSVCQSPVCIEAKHLNSVDMHHMGLALLPPPPLAFSKKSGGTFFSTFRGVWGVMRGS